MEILIYKPYYIFTIKLWWVILITKFKTKINRNKKNNQHTLSIPSFIFKQDLLEFEENALYEVEITKMPKKSEES
ncbi:hypothetical protein WKT22_02727 [Candidatus Lokiarchaeum ossiferum]